jgi:hypothetical protein
MDDKVMKFKHDELEPPKTKGGGRKSKPNVDWKLHISSSL